MAKFVALPEMSASQAAVIFALLNLDKVEVVLPDEYAKALRMAPYLKACPRPASRDCPSVQPYIYTDVDPKELCYPEGWCYYRGQLQSTDRTNGSYVTFLKKDGTPWSQSACYSVMPGES